MSVSVIHIRMYRVRINGQQHELTESQANQLNGQLTALLRMVKPIFNTIMDAVCRFYGVTMTDLTGRHRTDRVCWPRFVCCLLMVEVAQASHSEVGRFFKKDHGTILHAVKAARDRIETNPAERAEVEAIRANIQQVIQSQQCETPSE